VTGPEIDEYRRQVWVRYDYPRSPWCFVGIEMGFIKFGLSAIAAL